MTQSREPAPTSKTSTAPTTAATPSSAGGSSGGAALQLKRAVASAGGYDLQMRMLQPIQRHGGGGKEDTSGVHEAASRGIAGSGGALPHGSQIQHSFGRHDVGNIQAHTGGAASEASAAMGAEAYATGNHVAFAGTPDLHTVAHEAAHVVQQQAGVSLPGGVGAVGDSYEKHADQVADAVVQGKSAEGILDTMSGGSASGVQKKAVQRVGTPLGQETPVDAPQPLAETKSQRKFTPEQYIEMWEKEQGRKVTPAEKETIERGCIGIVAQNLNGGGNPLDSSIGNFSTFDAAYKLMSEKNAARDWWSNLPVVGGMFSNKRYVLFAKLFWSNQSEDPEARKNADPDAFKPDAEGKVDMTGYAYRAQVKKDDSGGYVNFDYGFWDEGSQCFWHANHCRYKDPEQNAEDPMFVLQSTKEKFAKGYIDFDRIVYGVALANNYSPGAAADTHSG